MIRSEHPFLKNHIARIDDPRLRRAFQAAVGLEQGSSAAS
jgi:hypothetical protein